MTRLLISPVVLDGALYVVIQMLTVLSTQMGTDEAAKYITPEPLFWLKIVIGETAAGLLALKLYRSTSYASHVEKQNGNGHAPPIQ